MYDVIIIGGGLAGLINAICLARARLKVLVIEKKSYPLHKVCGEYISNEVAPFLENAKLYPEKFNPPKINRFQLSSISGISETFTLDLGGFGISRYNFDHFLHLKAKEAGAEFLLENTAQDITFREKIFSVKLRNGQEYQSKIVIGAYGKRSNLDNSLNRKFFFRRSPYVGVKYHIQFSFPRDMVALHNFKGGYCGLAAIEDDKINLCYLANRDSLKRYGSIEKLEVQLLSKNLYLKEVFENARFINKKPEVINEISFEPKSAVENHILMSGDAAGMISPLCGNGMAMAIHSAKILSDLIIEFFNNKIHSLSDIEKLYTNQWNNLFLRRLWVGRNTQKLFGTPYSTELLMGAVKIFPPFAQWIIKQTHGKPF